MLSNVYNHQAGTNLCSRTDAARASNHGCKGYDLRSSDMMALSFAVDPALHGKTVNVTLEAWLAGAGTATSSATSVTYPVLHAWLAGPGPGPDGDPRVSPVTTSSYHLPNRGYTYLTGPLLPQSTLNSTRFLKTFTFRGVTLPRLLPRLFVVVAATTTDGSLPNGCWLSVAASAGMAPVASSVTADGTPTEPLLSDPRWLYSGESTRAGWQWNGNWMGQGDAPVATGLSDGSVAKFPGSPMATTGHPILPPAVRLTIKH